MEILPDRTIFYFLFLFFIFYFLFFIFEMKELSFQVLMLYFLSLRIAQAFFQNDKKQGPPWSAKCLYGWAILLSKHMSLGSWMNTVGHVNTK